MKGIALPPDSRDIPDVLARHVATRPQAEAVADGPTSITYEQLDRRVSAVAAALAAAGAGPEQVVGVLADRGWESVAAICGVLRAGAAFMLLDAAHPDARLQAMLDGACATLLLGHRSLLRRRRLMVERGAVALEDTAGAAPERVAPSPAVPANLAYIIYTSGTTGSPKGVAVDRRGLDNLLHAGVKGFHIRDDDRVLHFASVGFDGAVWEILGALHAGGTVVIYPRQAVDVGELTGVISERRATFANLPPTMLRLLDPAAVPSLATVVSCGEACTADVVALWLGAGRRLINGYGPAEAAVSAAIEDVQEIEEFPPIGRPLDNVRVYVLDEELREQPAGWPGGLSIGGPGVARGYLGMPGLTAERFFPDPFGPPGGRLYATGDRGRRRPDGRLEFTGRLDGQVKLHGQRIELEEIERALRDVPGVGDAIALVARVSGDARLAAYVVPGPGGPLTAGAIRAHLAGRLPDFMIPSLLARVDVLPLNPNGKVDRDALPPLVPGVMLRDRLAEPPRTRSEARVATAFAEVLQVGEAGRDDDFVALGGDSLAAMRAALKLGPPVTAGLVLQHRTVAGVAAVLDGDAGVVVRPAIARAARQHHLASPQQRSFFAEGPSPSQELRFALELPGSVDAGLLEAAFQDVIVRHEVLRTALVEVDGMPRQRVEREVEFRLGGGLGTLDLAAPPPLRAALERGESRTRLLVAVHRAAVDALSLPVLLRDVEALYRGERLGPASAQYREYAEWAVSGEGARLARREEAYWLGLFATAPRPGRAEPSTPVEFEIDAARTRALRGLAEREAAPLLPVLAAFCAGAAAAITGRDHVTIGVPVWDRDAPGLERAVGMFANTVCLRTRVDANRSVIDRARELSEAVAAAAEHRHYPIDELARSLGSGDGPPFDLLLTVQGAAMPAVELLGARAWPRTTGPGQRLFAARLHVRELPEALSCEAPGRLRDALLSELRTRA